MLDIGLGEVLLIAVLALLVFGPDRLPKVAADAARALRQVRQAASAARKDLADAAGLERDEELSGMIGELRDLDPRQVLKPLPPQRTGPAASNGGSRHHAEPAAPTLPATTTGASEAVQAPPTPDRAPAADPDWI